MDSQVGNLGANLTIDRPIRVRKVLESGTKGVGGGGGSRFRRAWWRVRRNVG